MENYSWLLIFLQNLYLNNGWVKVILKEFGNVLRLINSIEWLNI